MISGVPLAELARCFGHLRESGPNAGLRVEGVQKWGGGEKGQSWCCYMATLWLDLKFGGDAPVPRLGACDDVYALAVAKGWLRDTPEVDDLVLSMRDPDGPEGPKGFEDAHHIAIVTGDWDGATFPAIAGNTSADGRSSNGDRVAEHPIPFTGPTPRYKFVRYPKPWMPATA